MGWPNISEMDIKRVDLFNKETSDTIVTVDYSTSTVQVHK